MSHGEIKRSRTETLSFFPARSKEIGAGNGGKGFCICGRRESPTASSSMHYICKRSLLPDWQTKSVDVNINRLTDQISQCTIDRSIDRLNMHPWIDRWNWPTKLVEVNAQLHTELNIKSRRRRSFPYHRGECTALDSALQGADKQARR